MVKIFANGFFGANFEQTWTDSAQKVIIQVRFPRAVMAAFVGAGKQMYTTVSFFRSDLEAQGIEDVRDIRFTLTAFDYNDFTGDYIVEEELTFQPK